MLNFIEEIKNFCILCNAKTNFAPAYSADGPGRYECKCGITCWVNKRSGNVEFYDNNKPSAPQIGGVTTNDIIYFGGYSNTEATNKPESFADLQQIFHDYFTLSIFK
jgi:hypothetical protein